MYYMLTAFNFVFFFFALYFTWDEHMKLDKQGIEYDMYIFIAIPLALIGIILSIALAFGSLHVETLYLVGNAVEIYENTDLFYFAIIHILVFFIYILFIVKNVLDFYQQMVQQVTGKPPRDERVF